MLCFASAVVALHIQFRILKQPWPLSRISRNSNSYYSAIHQSQLTQAAVPKSFLVDVDIHRPSVHHSMVNVKAVTRMHFGSHLPIQNHHIPNIIKTRFFKTYEASEEVWFLMRSETKTELGDYSLSINNPGNVNVPQLDRNCTSLNTCMERCRSMALTFSHLSSASYVNNGDSIYPTRILNPILDILFQFKEKHEMNVQISIFQQFPNKNWMESPENNSQPHYHARTMLSP